MWFSLGNLLAFEAFSAFVSLKILYFRICWLPGSYSAPCSFACSSETYAVFCKVLLLAVYFCPLYALCLCPFSGGLPGAEWLSSLSSNLSAGSVVGIPVGSLLSFSVLVSTF